MRKLKLLVVLLPILAFGLYGAYYFRYDCEAHQEPRRLRTKNQRRSAEYTKSTSTARRNWKGHCLITTRIETIGPDKTSIRTLTFRVDPEPVELIEQR
jgi:hypothetical protein